jgi:hypothetical protein
MLAVMTAEQTVDLKAAMTAVQSVDLKAAMTAYLLVPGEQPVR